MNVTDMSPSEAVPTADETIASIIPLHKPKRAKTAAERSRDYRERKRKKGKAAAAPNDRIPSFESLSPESSSAPDRPVTPPPIVTVRDVARKDGRSRNISRSLLLAAALALAVVGIVMNGWFARSLGATDAAGWLFLAIGVAADLVALVVPSCAAGFGKPGTALLPLRAGRYGR